MLSVSASAAVRLRDGQAPQQRPAERYVDRRTGRVRLMLRDVEIAEPQREVDRVDVLERRRERRQMRDEIRRGDGPQHRPSRHGGAERT